MKKSILIAVTLLVAFVFLPAPSRADRTGEPLWLAEYFDNPSLSGKPVFAIEESKLSHDWGKSSPALKIPRDHFSARWTSTRFMEKGVYSFIMDVDDGARLWIDGELIIDAWEIGRHERIEVEVYIKKTGNHQIQVAYFEHTGYAAIYLKSLQLGSEKDIVSAWRGEYFNNPKLEGEPVLIRSDSEIMFDWDITSPSPKVTRDNFSVRWRRYSHFDGGPYKIQVRHDDGMRIYMDGELIYDSWHDQPPVNKVLIRHIKEGYHEFTVEYYEHIGVAVAQVAIIKKH